MKRRFENGFQKRKKKRLAEERLRNLDLPKISKFFVSARPTAAALESSSLREVGLLPDTSNIAASATVGTIDSDGSRDSLPDKLWTGRIYH